MFCHVTRACKGVVFESIEIVAELMKKTKTKQGLKVLVNIKEVYLLCFFLEIISHNSN